MNQTVRARRRRDAIDERITAMERASDSLLSICNILLMRAGGRVEIPAKQLEDVPRRHVQFVVVPADPEVAGSEMKYVISLEGYEAAAPVPQPQPSLLARLGFVVPRR